MLCDGARRLSQNTAAREVIGRDPAPRNLDLDLLDLHILVDMTPLPRITCAGKGWPERGKKATQK